MPGTRNFEPSPRLIDDERISGDMTFWTSGPKLTVSGIKSSYGGLYDTLLHTGNYTSIYVQEYVVRPDIPVTDLINTLSSSVKILNNHYTFTRKQRSQCLISPSFQPPLTPFSNILSPLRLATTTGTLHTTSTPPHTGVAIVDDDWDVVDVQVCISKELKQRVILCQFLRKLRPAFISPAFFGKSPRTTGTTTDIHHTNTTTTTLHKSCSNGTSSSNTNINTYNIMSNTNTRPRTYTIIQSINRHLNDSGYLLSNLYSVSPHDTCVNMSLDSHFKVQLENIWRDRLVRVYI